MSETSAPQISLRLRMFPGRARMHLATARWLAELRGDELWFGACDAAMRALERFAADEDFDVLLDPRLDDGILRGLVLEKQQPRKSRRPKWSPDDFTVKNAAQFLDISVRAVLHLLEDGRLCGWRIPPRGNWRIARRSVESLRKEW